MSEQADVDTRELCALCGNRCARPAHGAVWVFEWRIAHGPVSEMVTDSFAPVCSALARVPCSPLPGSQRTLWEEAPSGQRTWWLTIDARSLAAHRLQWLEQVVRAGVGVCRGDALVRGRAFGELSALAKAERVRAHQPDPLVDLCRELRSQPAPCTVPGTEREEQDQAARIGGALLDAARGEALPLAAAWRRWDVTLADGFAQVARLAEAETTRSSPRASRGARPRRFVQEMKIEPRAARWHVVIGPASSDTTRGVGKESAR